ncbi:MAG: DNA-binding protein [Prevotella sp.]|jgi:hypothetical protein|nr:DNA-binding protein [Prevotella sp.]
MKKILFILFFIYCGLNLTRAQNLEQLWISPPDKARPWVFWYWMQGAVSKEGITADLEAMKEVGLGGAYLMPIKGAPEKPFVTPIVEQLSPLWWEMVDFALKEADRLKLKMGFHVCDGFALAGGPWITPELSMQKVVWSRTDTEGGKVFNDTLPRPETKEGYYKDIAVFAYPALQGTGVSTETDKPEVTTDAPGMDPQFLADENMEGTFRSESPCRIQYAFDKPFTCRTIQVRPSGNNFQSQRLTVSVSDDGINYRKAVTLQPPRQGWQNQDFAMTHTVPSVTARYYRFEYDRAGTEPGAEDLDAAKWKQSLKIKGIYLSSEPRIHQYESKNGSIWRVGARTTAEQIPDSLCMDPQKIMDITDCLDKDGRIKWKVPEGKWTILRMGHTSTGHTNATGGKGAGLECDKFNPDAIRLQFNSWFGKAFDVAGADIASRVLKVFHVDSWECGSQNWSPVFRDEFRKRRGYDVYKYLPVMAGIPMESADVSERALYDVRQTVSELVADIFYRTLKEEANAKGCEFSAECVSPVMMSDGMMHYKYTDIPMGEYWLESPTHDKPNDILDAVSGAHIYEKNVVQAEAFTQLGMMFTEHPAALKSLQDRHYALGINRLSYHVNVLNPWMDRKPGMTLDGIGLLFQRDQTWWKMGRAWVDYAQRCHALLQYGRPVVDIAVFTGEEFPRRAMLPDRLLPFLPGIFGREKVAQEKVRMANVGLPTRRMSVGVDYSANMTEAKDWVNALRGYQYDSFNKDVLLNCTQVENGRLVLPGGMSYSALIVPGKHPMQPESKSMSIEVLAKIKDLSDRGAPVLMSERPVQTLGYRDKDREVEWNSVSKLIKLPYMDETFDKIGIERDFTVMEEGVEGYAGDVAYTHRQANDTNIYFISNQVDRRRSLEISLRAAGRIPEIWDPVTGEIKTDNSWRISDGRTVVNIVLEPKESLFVVLQTLTEKKENKERSYTMEAPVPVKTTWSVQFDKTMRGVEKPVVFEELTDWSENDNDSIRYYSGTAVYSGEFDCVIKPGERCFLYIDDVANVAEVKINGRYCGTLWTPPYRVEVTDALKNGSNKLEISVANTWANRIMGDEDFAMEKNDSRMTWTNARYRLADKKPVKSGLTGKARIQKIMPLK